MSDFDSPILELREILSPAVAFVAGIAAKALNDWLSARRTQRREREARSEARSDLLRQRRADLQRETLISLQDACMRLLRTTTQTHLHDLKTFRETGKWQTAGIPDDVDEACRLANAAVTTLKVRVRDDQVRLFVQELQDTCYRIVECSDEAASERGMAALVPVHQNFNERVGQLLLSLDEDDVILPPATR